MYFLLRIIRLLLNNELEKVWKEIVAASFWALSRHLPGSLRENHKQPQSRYSLSWLNFEIATS